MRWWGWGDPARSQPVPAHLLARLRAELQIEGEETHPPVALEQVELPASRLQPAARRALTEAVGADGVREDHATRVLHCAGKGYPDLVRLRAGRPEGAPDAVVYPSTHDQVRRVLDACAQARTAVVPWGGGTSVVGGVAPVRGALDAVVALDLRGLGQLVAVDALSSTVTAQAGMRGPDLESALRAQGLSLGHYPQSFEYVSIGGCVATRSAGQASSGYGRVDELVLGLRCGTPAGDLSLPPVPASAAGPDLRQLLIGSEGTLGVLTEVCLRVRPRPEQEVYEGVFFRSFAAGSEALRAAARRETLPDVARLSDEAETDFAVTLAGAEGTKARIGQAYLRLRGYAGGCLAVLGWGGERDAVARRRASALATMRAHGGLSVGTGPGRRWATTRFDAPYLRDSLLERGVMAETLETAAPWSALPGLYEAIRDAVREALAARGTPARVLCHISHLYETGASLYFTILARQESGAEIEQWQALKAAAGDAIVAGGGTITHHHAVGRDHAPWLPAEIGPVGVAALQALKRELDPAGIMNPGKLLPALSPEAEPAARTG